MTPHLFVGTNGLSVWHSDNLGDSIVRMQSTSGLYSGSQVWALASHPAVPGQMLAGTDTGIYRLNLATKTWTHCPSPMDDNLVTAIEISPHDPNVVLAAIQPATMFRSDDGGNTWHPLNVPFAGFIHAVVQDGRIVSGASTDVANRHWNRVTQIVFDPLDPKSVWAGVEIDGVWRSQDGGETWERCRDGMTSDDLHGLAVVRNGARIVYATTNKGLHVSRDGGAHWTLQRIESPWQYTRSIVPRADESGIVFMTNGDGPPGSVGRLQRSRDHGAHWEDAGLPGEIESTVWSVATHPADPNLIFVAACLGQMFRSTDGGESWVKLKRRLGEIRIIKWLPVG